MTIRELAQQINQGHPCLVEMRGIDIFVRLDPDADRLVVDIAIEADADVLDPELLDAAQGSVEVVLRMRRTPNAKLLPVFRGVIPLAPTGDIDPGDPPC